MNAIWSQVLITSIIIIVLVILTIVLYWLFTRQSVAAKKKAFEHLHQNLKTGQYVEFANGLVGRVKSIGLEYCDIEVSPGVTMTVSRYTISRFIESEELKRGK